MTSLNTCCPPTFHRPYFFPTETIDDKGRVRKHYRDQDIMTPYEKLKSLPDATAYLTPGTTFEQLDQSACKLSENQPAQQLNEARQRLFQSINHALAPGA